MDDSIFLFNLIPGIRQVIPFRFLRSPLLKCLILGEQVDGGDGRIDSMLAHDSRAELHRAGCQVLDGVAGGCAKNCGPYGGPPYAYDTGDIAAQEHRVAQKCR
mgnify:CR=1 FL=1